MLRVAIVLASCVLAACGALDTRRPNVTMAETAACVDARSIESGTVERVSREASTLVVSVLDKSFCNMHAKEPDVRIAGNVVALSWRWMPEVPHEYAKCYCGRHLVFRVEHVPAGEVSVTVAGRWP